VDRGEVFPEGDGVGTKVPKRGEVTATGGAPLADPDVEVTGLFLFTAIMWKVE
jgi:hypothetical protein